MEAPLQPPESQVVLCPNCQAKIKTSPSTKARRAQCPKCREIVTLAAMKKAAPEIDVPAAVPAADEKSPALLARIETLEARLLHLEKTITEAVQAQAVSRLKWLPREQAADFSDAQEAVLRHNLGTVPAHRITIQSPAGDQPARTRAEWFKGVFERAAWAVDGPLEGSTAPEPGGLFIATSLPVSREMASTFLALQAAGFLPTTIFDPSLQGEERLIVA
jgi:hypothetical protein